MTSSINPAALPPLIGAETAQHHGDALGEFVTVSDPSNSEPYRRKAFHTGTCLKRRFAADGIIAGSRIGGNRDRTGPHHMPGMFQHLQSVKQRFVRGVRSRFDSPIAVEFQFAILLNLQRRRVGTETVGAGLVQTVRMPIRFEIGFDPQFDRLPRCRFARRE